jgi:phosphoadenosine phosphosulfate reductase
MAPPALSREEVDALAADFARRPAEDVLRWAADRFAGGIVLTCSWQMTSSVLVHMVHRLGLDVRIVELDTGLLFPETYAVRDALVQKLGLTVERVVPHQTVDEQEASHGPALWERAPDRCCALRKVEPFERALAGASAWVTGIRRDQSATRADARVVELDAVRGLVKVQPLVGWSESDVRTYLMVNEVPYNALHDQGYPSIGCIPCTRAVASGDDPRAGRWADSGKTECGLHLTGVAEEASI